MVWYVSGNVLKLNVLQLTFIQMIHFLWISNKLIWKYLSKSLKFVSVNICVFQFLSCLKLYEKSSFDTITLKYVMKVTHQFLPFDMRGRGGGNRILSKTEFSDLGLQWLEEKKHTVGIYIRNTCSESLSRLPNSTSQSHNKY